MVSDGVEGGPGVVEHQGAGLEVLTGCADIELVDVGGSREDQRSVGLDPIGIHMNAIEAGAEKIPPCDSQSVDRDGERRTGDGSQ